MTLSTAQQELRRHGIGGSDIGAILRRNPWKGPTDVWLDKTGRAPAKASTQRSRNGHRFEPVARAWYAEEGPAPGCAIRQVGTITHPSLDWVRLTPDGLVYRSPEALVAGEEPTNGLEIKTHTLHLRHLYGDAGTDQVPIWELLQCAWYMGGTGLPYFDLVALVDGEFTPYRIHRDLELEAMILEAAEDFWTRYVLTDTPPPPDGGKGYDEHLRRTFPRHKHADLVQADDAVAAAALELRDLKREIVTREQREAELVNIIKTAIGDAAGITFPEDGAPQRITWKAAKDSTVTDWAALGADALGTLGLHASTARAVHRRLAAALEGRGAFVNAVEGDHATAALAELLEALDDTAAALEGIGDADPHAFQRMHTHTKPGSRRFLCPKAWGKGDE